MTSGRESVVAILSVIRSSIHTFTHTQASFLAAAVAYYAFVSLLPLVAVGAVVAATLAGGDLVAQILAETGDVFTPETQRLLVDALTAGAERAGLSVVAVLLTLWGALRVFRGLDAAFSRLYRTHGQKSLLSEFKNGLIVISAITLGIATMAGLGILIGRIPVLGTALGSVFLVGALAVVLFPVYFVFPDYQLTIGEAAPGAVIAAVGWTLLWSLFQVYVSLAGDVSVYGPLGGVLLLVTFFYFAAIVLLGGATVNVVITDRQLQRGQQPNQQS